MEITEIRMKLATHPSDKLRAYCTVTLDHELVIRDIKIISGTKGHFVAMPSRKLADKCPTCGHKNHLRAKYCNECGGRLQDNRVALDPDGRAKLHADVVHPIHSAFREKIQKRILEEFEKMGARSEAPASAPSAPEPSAPEASAPEVESEPDVSARPPEVAPELDMPARPPEVAPEPKTQDERSFGEGIL
jgi:stage V sporulation protein G